MPHVKLIHWINFISIFQYYHHNKLAACHLPHAACQLYTLKIFSFSNTQHHYTLAACRRPHAACQTHTFKIIHFLCLIAIILINLPHAACEIYTLKIFSFSYINMTSQFTCRLPPSTCLMSNSYIDNIFFWCLNTIINLPLATCHMPHVKHAHLFIFYFLYHNKHIL